jgi:hypothetical protein
MTNEERVLNWGALFSLTIRFANNGAPNNSLNASGMSAAFIRRTWMPGSVSPAALIRALGGFMLRKLRK